MSVGVYWQGKVDHESSFLFFEPRYEGESLSYWVRHLYSYDRTRHLNYPAQEALLHLGENALPLLLDWISRPEPRIYTPGNIQYQRHAVNGFEVLGPIARPAIPRLLENVSDGSDYAMQALGFIGRDAVLPLADKLLETLADKGEPVTNRRDPRYKANFFHVQLLILRGLREMGTNAEAAIPAVVKALNANHAWTRQSDPYATLASIGQNRPEIVIPSLIGALTNATAPPFNRGAAAQAMASFGTNGAHVFLTALINTLNDKRTDDWNRRTMAGALAAVGQHHPDLVMPALIEAFTNSAIDYRDGIAKAMAVFEDGARPALPLLLAAAKSPNFYLRKNAAIAIKSIAPERTNTLSVLIKDLNHPEPGLRQQAIYALGSLGTNGVDAVPALLNCLSHPDPQTRIDATRALNNIGVTSDEFIAGLGENLSHSNSFVCSEAYSTLGRLAGGSRLAFVTLARKGISSPVQRDVRQQAKSILAEASRNDPKFLLECLDDPDSKVRTGALVVFYELAQRIPESIARLQWMTTNEPDSYTRSLAADVLRLQLQ